mmetsp:Transcript_21625/g.10081  ORF Transcript_21625/g.10081 Transcript_21625/m.10081 type:complete len:119 (+) Transcript_21625:521-877(+)
MTLKLLLFNNSSMCECKEGDWPAAIESATKALAIQPGYQKALYRRAYARMKYAMFKEAKMDIVTAIRKEPNNKDLRALHDEIKKAEAEAEATEKKRFKGMFDKLDIYEEKTIPSQKGP